MRKSRFSEEQIIGFLKEVEAGRKISAVCREHGIAEATLYRWRSKYSGPCPAVVPRISSLVPLPPPLRFEAWRRRKRNQ